VGVLADDFSGAGDVALAFRAAGFSAEIWAPVGGPPVPPRTRVWIIDTESRGLTPRAADRTVRRGLATLAPWKPDFIFKKIDSTLRGPVGAELAAFIDVLRPVGPVPFVPAFPKMKRTTVGGRHFVGGVPLNKTAFAKDPRHPVETNVVARILSNTYKKGFDCQRNLTGKTGFSADPDKKVFNRRTLTEETSFSPDSCQSGFNQQNVPARERVWGPDVGNEREMAGVARRVLASGRVAVGSAGFAAALARAMGGGQGLRNKEPGENQKPFSFGTTNSARVGVVAGSAHPLSERQLNRLKNALPHPNVFVVERPLRREVPGTVLRRLVSAARVLEKAHGIRRWVVTGGETGFALARIWNEPRWRVVGSIEPGVPLCRSLGQRARWLVLKPGGFGSTEVFLKSVRRLLRKDD
jgi:uncharacterized protein YgbK (DUF1537 family)